MNLDTADVEPQSSSSALTACSLASSLTKSSLRPDRKRKIHKHHKDGSNKITKIYDVKQATEIAVDRYLKNILQSNTMSNNSSSNTSSSFNNNATNHIIENRINFVKFTCQKLFNEICGGKGSVEKLVKLLFEATEDMKEQTIWLESSTDQPLLDPIELIRPKNPKVVDYNHAIRQPLNWACRRGHVALLEFLINASPWDDIFTPNLGNDKLFLGAIPLALQSHNIHMVDYLCRDLGMDPNRGPKGWEPNLVVFWEIDNWDLLLALIRGGASLYHECPLTMCTLTHMYENGWGWDPETRLDALLTLLFLGVPYYEDQEYRWPACTQHSRDFNQFKANMSDIREVVCWNNSYEYVLDFLIQTRYKIKQNLKALALAQVQAAAGSAIDTVDFTASDALNHTHVSSTINTSTSSSLVPTTAVTSTLSSLAATTAVKSKHSLHHHHQHNHHHHHHHVSSSKPPSAVVRTHPHLDNLDFDLHRVSSAAAEEAEQEDDHEYGTVSTESDDDDEDMFELDERFLLGLRRQWMNSVALILRKKNMSIDLIRLIFATAVPNLRRKG